MLAVPHSTEVGEQHVSNVSQSLSLLVLAGSCGCMNEPKIFLLSPGIRGYIHTPCISHPIPGRLWIGGGGGAEQVVQTEQLQLQSLQPCRAKHS